MSHRIFGVILLQRNGKYFLFHRQKMEHITTETYKTHSYWFDIQLNDNNKHNFYVGMIFSSIIID